MFATFSALPNQLRNSQFLLHISNSLDQISFTKFSEIQTKTQKVFQTNLFIFFLSQQFYPCTKIIVCHSTIPEPFQTLLPVPLKHNTHSAPTLSYVQKPVSC